MITVGLIGGIGSGKSQLARVLQDLGAEVIDADLIGHRVLERVAVKKQLVSLWGKGILEKTGRINREAVSEKVFSDGEKLKQLNAIVHPIILAEIRRQLKRAENKKTKVAVVDAALLLESGLDEVVDYVVYVRAGRRRRLARVRDRSGWTGRQFSNRESAQIPLRIKAGRADMIIENHSSIEQLQKQGSRLWSQIIKQSSSRN